MRRYDDQNRWRMVRGKKRARWSILTLDDLPETNEKYSELISLLRARYQANKELGDDKPRKKSEGFPIQEEVMGRKGVSKPKKAEEFHPCVQ